MQKNTTFHTDYNKKNLIKIIVPLGNLLKFFSPKNWVTLFLSSLITASAQISTSTNGTAAISTSWNHNATNHTQITFPFILAGLNLNYSAERRIFRSYRKQYQTYWTVHLPRLLRKFGRESGLTGWGHRFSWSSELVYWSWYCPHFSLISQVFLVVFFFSTEANDGLVGAGDYKPHERWTV